MKFYFYIFWPRTNNPFSVYIEKFKTENVYYQVFLKSDEHFYKIRTKKYPYRSWFYAHEFVWNYLISRLYSFWISEMGMIFLENLIQKFCMKKKIGKALSVKFLPGLGRADQPVDKFLIKIQKSSIISIRKIILFWPLR